MIPCGGFFVVLGFLGTENPVSIFHLEIKDQLSSSQKLNMLAMGAAAGFLGAATGGFFKAGPMISKQYRFVPSTIYNGKEWPRSNTTWSPLNSASDSFFLLLSKFQSRRNWCFLSDAHSDDASHSHNRQCSTRWRDGHWEMAESIPRNCCTHGQLRRVRDAKEKDKITNFICILSSGSTTRSSAFLCVQNRASGLKLPVFRPVQPWVLYFYTLALNWSTNFRYRRTSKALANPSNNLKKIRKSSDSGVITLSHFLSSLGNSTDIHNLLYA